MNNEKNKPIKKARCGNIQVAVWENGEEEHKFYSCTIEKSYKEGEEWKTCKSYNITDIPKIQSCLAYIYDKMTLKFE